MSTIRPVRILAALGVATAISLGAGVQGAQAATGTSASQVLAKIRYCESGNNYRAQNPTSTASGAYQFLDSTWQGLSAAKGYSRAMYAPASVQDAAALELYSQAGTSPWAASQSCWSRLTSVPTTTSTSSTSSTASSASTTSTSTTSATSASSRTQASSASRTAARRTSTATRTVERRLAPARPGRRHSGAPDVR